MPYVQGTRERLMWMFWDSVTLASSQVAATLFQNPVGAGSTAKTIYNTNMRGAGQLPAGNRFEIYAIKAAAIPAATPANLIALQKGTANLVVGHKSYFETPLFLLAAGGGYFGQMSSLGTDAAGTAAAVYCAPKRSIFTLPDPIVITDQESFRVELVWPAAPGNTLVQYITLEGILERPVQ